MRAEPYNLEWVLPQGYVKTKESLEEAARREVWEEFRIRVEVERFVGIYEDFRQENERELHYVIAFYIARAIGPTVIHATRDVIDSV